MKSLMAPAFGMMEDPAWAIAALLPCADRGGLLGVLVTLNGCGHARASGNAQVLVKRGFFQCREKQQHVGLLTGISHQPDTPDFSLGRPDAARNLDIEFVEELVANLPIIERGRDFHCGHS